MCKALGVIAVIISVGLLLFFAGLIYESAMDWQGFAEGRELRLAGAMALFGVGGVAMLVVGIGLLQIRNENR